MFRGPARPDDISRAGPGRAVARNSFGTISEQWKLVLLTFQNFLELSKLLNVSPNLNVCEYFNIILGISRNPKPQSPKNKKL